MSAPLGSHFLKWLLWFSDGQGAHAGLMCWQPPPVLLLLFFVFPIWRSDNTGEMLLASTISADGGHGLFDGIVEGVKATFMMLILSVWDIRKKSGLD